MKRLLMAALFCACWPLRAQTPAESVFIHTDREVYAPQEQMSFAAWVSAAPDPDSKLYLMLMNPEGKPVMNLDFPLTGSRLAGVAAIPDTLRDGVYRLFAWTTAMEKGSSTDVFTRKVFIRKSKFQDLFIKLTPDAAWYVQGEYAQIKAHITTADNKPYANDQLIYLATKNGNPYQNGLGKTDENGDALLMVRIPATGEEGVLLVSVQAESGKLKGSASILIPGGGAPLFLSFFPEGGSMIAGSETRVAFQAKDFQGEPFEFAGVILNQKDQVIDSIKTNGSGTGSVILTPALKDTLRVKVTKPAGMIREIRLPVAKSGGIRLILNDKNNGNPVFRVSRIAPSPAGELVAVASYGGKEIMRQPLTPADTQSFRVPVDGLRGGLLYVSLVNPSGRVVAQRPLFVKPAAPPVIATEAAGKAKSKDPDQLSLSVTDASGRPVDATLSISVSDAVMSPVWCREPDIRSWFLMGHLAKILTPGFFSGPTFDAKVADNLALTGIDTTFNRKQPADFCAALVKFYQPTGFEKLAAAYHRDRFFSDYFVSGAQDFTAFLKTNKTALQEMGYLPGKPTQDDRVRQQLETGIPVLSVIRSIKPYTLTDNQIFFAKGKNSLQYPKGALIIVDGTEKGYNADVLNFFSPYDIATIRVSEKISDILKYSADASGLIVITTKKAAGDSESKEARPEKIYNPTRFWCPATPVTASGLNPLKLPEPELKSLWKMVIRGIDSQGNFFESVK